MSTSKHIRHTSESIAGVVLIDEDHLKELANVVKEQRKDLRAIRSQEIRKHKSRFQDAFASDHPGLLDTDIEQHVKDSFVVPYPFDYDETSVEYIFKSGDRIEQKHVMDVAALSSVDDDECTELHVRMRIGRFNSEFHFWQVIPFSFSSEMIRINVTPDDRVQSQRTFDAFRSFASDCVLPKPFTWWRRFSGVASTALFIIGFLCLYGWASFKADQQRADLSHRELAAKFAREGVGGGNRDEAIRLLLVLALEKDDDAGVEPDVGLSNRSKEVPGTFLSPTVAVVLSTIVLLLIVLSFPPKSHIAIGRGKTRLKLARHWIRVVTYLIPSFVILGVLASSLGSILVELLWHR